MVVCRASGCAMIEGGWWDEVVEFLGTLSEVQSVEDRQAGDFAAMNQAMELGIHQFNVANEPPSSAFH